MSSEFRLDRITAIRSTKHVIKKYLGRRVVEKMQPEQSLNKAGAETSFKSSGLSGLSNFVDLLFFAVARFAQVTFISHFRPRCELSAGQCPSFSLESGRAERISATNANVTRVPFCSLHNPSSSSQSTQQLHSRPLHPCHFFVLLWVATCLRT